MGHYLTAGLQGGVGFVGKGSINGYLFQGHMAAHGSGAYGELGGFISQITNDRPGALVETGEFSLTLNVQSKASAFTALLVDNIGVGSLAAYNWHRGIWTASNGTAVSGDALYVDGSGGWTNFAMFKDTSAVQRFKMDATGKMFIGTNANTLYDAGAGLLKTDSVFEADAGFYSNGGPVQAGKHSWSSDAARFVTWGSGAPGIAGAVGAIYLRTDGGAGTTLYVKESGTGTSGWVAK
jgi:hypothetical protein